MKGKTLMTGLLVLAAVFGGVLWYFQTYAFYHELPAEPLTVQGTAYPTTAWQGIDATSSPLKRRVCLKVAPDTAARILADQVKADTAQPLVAPSWFDCFDAKALAQDISSGAAKAYMMGASGFEGVDEYLAVYADGHAFIWRQLQPKYANQ